MTTRQLFTLASLALLLLAAATGCTDDHSDPNEPLRTGLPVDLASIRIASSSSIGGSGAAGMPSTDVGGFYPGDVIHARLLHNGTTQVARLTNTGTTGAPKWKADTPIYWQSATTAHTLTLSRGEEGDFTLPDDMNATTPVTATGGSGGTTNIPNYTLHDRLFASHTDLLPGNAIDCKLEHRMAQIVVTLTPAKGSKLPTASDLSNARVSMTLPAEGHFDGTTGKVSRRNTGGAAAKKTVNFLKGSEQAGVHSHFAVALPGSTGTQVITITIPADGSSTGMEQKYQYTASADITLEEGRSRVFRLSLVDNSVSAISITTTDWKDAAQEPDVSEGLRIEGVTAGNLAKLLPKTIIDYKHVRVSGALNGDDYGALRRFLDDLPSPVSLEIEIKGGDKAIIPGRAFYECQKLGAVVLKGMEQIGELAFSSSSLTSITLPEGLKDIGRYAFIWCQGLKSITLPSLIKTLDVGAFRDCTNLASVSLPEKLETIGSYAFYKCTSLKSISLPALVTTWGEEIFYGSGLTSIDLPEGMEEIPSNTFANCNSLQTIILPAGLKTIGNRAFYECAKLQKVAINDYTKIISVGTEAFAGTPIGKELFDYGFSSGNSISNPILGTDWQTIYYDYQGTGDKLATGSYSSSKQLSTP